MKILLLALSLSFGGSLSGWVVDSDLHGCNFGSERGPGFCAGTLTVQTTDSEGKPDYQSVAVPYAVAISRKGEKSTLPREGWVAIEYDVEYNGRHAGVKTATSVTLEDRSGGPQRFVDRKPGFDAKAMTTDELKSFVKTGFLSSHASAVRQLVSRGESAAVREHLNGDDRLRRVVAVWSLADILDASFASDMAARLSDSEPYARAEAVYYFKALKRPEVSDKVGALLKDSYGGARQLAAEYLGTLKVAKFKPQLESLAKGDKEEYVRNAAQKALAELAKP